MAYLRSTGWSLSHPLTWSSEVRKGLRLVLLLGWASYSLFAPVSLMIGTQAYCHRRCDNWAQTSAW
eukprot:2026921-Amphidinium_carterae.1